MGARSDWPTWWEWALELTPHLLKRMVDRRFSEVELREMLETAMGYRADIVEGRYVINSRHRRKRWEIISRAGRRCEAAGGHHSLPVGELKT